MTSAEQKKAAAVTIARKACRTPGMLTAAEISLLAGAFLEAVGAASDQPKPASAPGSAKNKPGRRKKS